VTPRSARYRCAAYATRRRPAEQIPHRIVRRGRISLNTNSESDHRPLYLVHPFATSLQTHLLGQPRGNRVATANRRMLPSGSTPPGGLLLAIVHRVADELLTPIVQRSRSDLR